MKTKYIMAMGAGALGSALAIVLPCTAVSVETSSPRTYPPVEAPSMPPSAVWDGSEYVGQVDGRYYYLGPNNTWYALDQTRQQRFDDWQKSHAGANNSNEGTRSQGPAKGENASEQSGNAQPTGEQPNGYPMGQAPTWNNPSSEPNGIRNTRYQGHDMGQTHPIAPPIQNTSDH